MSDSKKLVSNYLGQTTDSKGQKTYTGDLGQPGLLEALRAHNDPNRPVTPPATASVVTPPAATTPPATPPAGEVVGDPNNPFGKGHWNGTPQELAERLKDPTWAAMYYDMTGVTPPSDSPPGSPTDTSGAGLPSDTSGATGTGGVLKGSQTAFGLAFGQLMGKATQFNELNKQKNLLMKQLFDQPLSAEDMKGLSPAQQMAIHNSDKDLIENQIMTINDTIKGRSDENKQALNYMIQGYQEDQKALQAKQAKAYEGFSNMMNKYPQLYSYLSPQGVAAVQKGELPPQADLLKLSKVYGKMQTTTEGGIGYQWDAATETWKPLAGGSGSEETIAAYNVDKPIDTTTEGYMTKTIAEAGGLTQAQIDQAANEYALTGKLPAVGMTGKGDPALQRKAIQNRGAALATLSGYDMTYIQSAYAADRSALTKMSTYSRQVAQFEGTAALNLDVALEAMKRVDNTGSPFINRYRNALKKNAFGDPDLAAYHAAIHTFAQEYAKVMAGNVSSSGVTVSSAREAEEMINDRLAKGQVDAIVKIMRKDMANRKEEIDKQVANIDPALQSYYEAIHGAGSSGTGGTVGDKQNDPLGIL